MRAGPGQPLVRSQAALDAFTRDLELPALLLDLDAFDRNISKIRFLTEAAKKTLRPASKSVRCPKLLARILERGGPSFRGLLTYSLSESLFLASLPGEEFTDLLIAYPTLETTLLTETARILREKPTALTFMVDDEAHLEFLHRFAERTALPSPIQICIDLDLAYRPLGVHLGVRRSPIRSEADLSALLALLPNFPHLRFRGLMGYEAQIAGLPDENPFAPVLNPAKKLIKTRSARDVAHRRAEAAALVKAQGFSLELFNGGGTGSLRSTAQEPWLTEMTAGSGFFQSHLFDYYATNTLEPALYLALRVTRRPDARHITCQSGGFIASGEIAPEKAPIPVFPEGLRSLSTEGFGEVQTPFTLPPGLELAPGSAILCRPAKAGEITEHFNEILAVRSQFSNGAETLTLLERFPTYRGLGQVFR